MRTSSSSLSLDSLSTFSTRRTFDVCSTSSSSSLDLFIARTVVVAKVHGEMWNNVGWLIDRSAAA